MQIIIRFIHSSRTITALESQLLCRIRVIVQILRSLRISLIRSSLFLTTPNLSSFLPSLRSHLPSFALASATVSQSDPLS